MLEVELGDRLLEHAALEGGVVVRLEHAAEPVEIELLAHAAERRGAGNALFVRLCDSDHVPAEHVDEHEDPLVLPARPRRGGRKTGRRSPKVAADRF